MVYPLCGNAGMMVYPLCGSPGIMVYPMCCNSGMMVHPLCDNTGMTVYPMCGNPGMMVLSSEWQPWYDGCVNETSSLWRDPVLRSGDEWADRMGGRRMSTRR